jgi:hypothetical protein
LKLGLRPPPPTDIRTAAAPPPPVGRQRLKAETGRGATLLDALLLPLGQYRLDWIRTFAFLSVAMIAGGRPRHATDPIMHCGIEPSLSEVAHAWDAGHRANRQSI